MRWLWWALGMGVSGCGEPALAPMADTDGLPDVAQVFTEVSRLRELPARRVPRTRFLRYGEYRAAMQRLGDGELQGLEAAAQTLGLSAKPSGVRDEQARMLASNGMYAQRDATIYVLDDPNRRFPILLEQVVAHESVHALQHQHGLLPSPDQRFSGDEGLARRALLEGDATLGMLLYEERNWRIPPRRLAERVRRGFAEKPISRYVGATAVELRDSPAYQQEMVLFPYRAGAAFVAALLTAGGYGLVAQAFKSPPRTTSQILHPERYARGEEPVTIPAAPPVGGYAVWNSTTLGELVTRSLLLRCNSEERALRAADGWRGDVATIMKQGQSELVAQQWLMDTSDDAHELAEALRAGCDDLHMTVVVERGARVVAIRGGDAPLGSQLATSWLSVPLANSTTARPLGSVELTPLPPRRQIRAPFVQASVLHFPEAGIELPVPHGFENSTEHPHVLERARSHASITLRPLLGEYFEDAPRQILNELSRSMQLAIAYSNVIAMGAPYAVSLPVGRGMALDFEHEGTLAQGRVLAISRCNGAGLLAVVQYYGEGEKAAENAALQGLSAAPDDAYCSALTQGR